MLCVFADCKSEGSYCRKGHEKRRNSTRNDVQPDEHNLSLQRANSGNHGYTNLVNDRYASDERMCQSTSIGGGGGRPSQNSLTENSPASYTTSLSTDTLYWDDDPMVAAGQQAPSSASRQHSVKSQSSSTYRRDNCAVKPVKSWDNLTTKAFGGYGFGYEYLDRDQIANNNNNGGGGSGQHHMVYLQLKNVKGGQKHHGGGSGGHHHHHHHHHQHQQQHHNHHNQQHHHHHRHNADGRIRHPTKSTEALLSLPPQYPIAAIESSASCEYLDACSSSSSLAAGGGYFAGYIRNDKASQTDCRRYAAQHQQQLPPAEVTRL